MLLAGPMLGGTNVRGAVPSGLTFSWAVPWKLFHGLNAWQLAALRRGGGVGGADIWDAAGKGGGGQGFTWGGTGYILRSLVIVTAPLMLVCSRL